MPMSWPLRWWDTLFKQTFPVLRPCHFSLSCESLFYWADACLSRALRWGTGLWATGQRRDMIFSRTSQTWTVFCGVRRTGDGCHGSFPITTFPFLRISLMALWVKCLRSYVFSFFYPILAKCTHIPSVGVMFYGANKGTQWWGRKVIIRWEEKL